MSNRSSRPAPHSDPAQSPNLSPSSSSMPDTGILCILLLARFFGLPADGAQLRHQFGQSGKPLDDADLLRAAKSLDLKAGIVRTDMAHLAGTPLPAIAKRHDGRYVIIAKVEGENVLVHDPHEQRPT